MLPQGGFDIDEAGAGEGLEELFAAHAAPGTHRLDIDRFVAAQASLARALGESEDKLAATTAFMALAPSADGEGGASAREAFCRWQLEALRSRGVGGDRMAEAFRRVAGEASRAPAKAGPRARAAARRAAAPEPARSRGALLCAQQAFRDLAEHGRAAPEECALSLGALAAYLVRDARTEEQRAWALYAWVCHHVAYDVDGLLGRKPMQSCRPEDVLRSRRSVCAGYAAIFEALAAEVGLTVRQVSGHARTSSSRVDQDIVRQSAGAHAWNAIKLGEEWILIDCTWGAGTAAEVFERRFSPHFFGVPPRQLAFSHYPSQPEWQLLEPPLSYATFVSQPIVSTDSFFGHGLEFAPYRPSGTITTTQEGHVQLRMQSGTSLLLKLGPEKLEYQTTTDDMDSSMKMARILVPQGRMGTLSIFARSGGPYGSYDFACNFSVRCT